MNMTNLEIAQLISEAIGPRPIPFQDVRTLALEIYHDLGGQEDDEDFEDIFEILLSIIPLTNLIDDTVIVPNKTWSSEKINEELQSIAGIANSEFDGKTTEDFTFVSELPVSGEEGQQVIIKGENVDVLYKYITNAWVEQTPDANILYFDTENEALYSYITSEHQFAPISTVDTIVVGKNLNTNAALKNVKTPGVYNVLQRTSSTTKGEYTKKWTLTVEGVDYDEYELTDSVYQKLQSNYTIQKRTWSSSRQTNDGWTSFATYYAGEIKDSKTSKYYTWSSDKISTELANKQSPLIAGQNIDITNDTISAKGYVFDETNGSMAEKYRQDVEDGGAITANVSIGLGSHAEGYGTIAWDNYGAHAEGNGWLSNVKNVTFTWTADSNTITASSDSHNLKVGYIVFYNDVYAKVTAVSGTSITLSNTLGEAQTSVSIKYALGIATGSASHAEGSGNLAIGLYSHAEGFETVSSGGYGSHSEGYWTKAYGQVSHAEGYNTEASGNLSHAEGFGSKATNYQTHAEGCNTLASGFRSHAEGEFTVASGRISHAEGCQNLAQNAFEHSSGVCNKSHSVSADWTSFGSAGNTLFSIGDKYPEPESEYSPADGNGNNAVEIMQNADFYVKGIGGYDGVHIKSETGYESTKTLQEVIAEKQDTLTEGAHIDITNNVISVEYQIATTQEIQALFVMPAFYVDNTQFITNGKMTWGQWLNSKYNTSSFTHIYTASSYDSSTEQIPEVSSSSYPVAGGYYYSTCQDTYVPQTGPANDEIWYTTESGNLWEPIADYGEGEQYIENTLLKVNNGSATILSNNYVNGHGVIKYSEPITSLDYQFGKQYSDNIPLYVTDLTTLTLPNSITFVDDILNGTAPELESIYYNGTVAECGEIDWEAFDYNVNLQGDNVIICLDGTYQLDSGGGDEPYYGGGGGY